MRANPGGGKKGQPELKKPVALGGNGRLGFTTGACAAAAAKTATAALINPDQNLSQIEIPFPGGGRFILDVLSVRPKEFGAEAIVIKDAGDDPDVTDGVKIKVFAQKGQKGGVILKAGPGIGVVTKPGLMVACGDPAINPVPREMIKSAVREVTNEPIVIEISIIGGEELAKKTYNPRLGIVGGLSILGTSGRVRPFSLESIRCSIQCAMGIAKAASIKEPVLVPGRIGERAAKINFDLQDEEVIEVSNEWGFALESLSDYGFERVMVLGHPGKLIKLAAEEWDTHSSRSRSPLEILELLGMIPQGTKISGQVTIEGFFSLLGGDKRRPLADDVALKIREAAGRKIPSHFNASVVLIDMSGNILGTSGDFRFWKRRDGR